MGVGGAFIMPATLSIITSIFPPHERIKAIAIWAGFAGAGGSIGPIVTGGLLEGFWWGSDAARQRADRARRCRGRVGLPPSSRRHPYAARSGWGPSVARRAERADLRDHPGSRERGTSTPVVAAFATSAVSLGLFVLWERRAEHPMLP